jgi:hypothetical protein
MILVHHSEQFKHICQEVSYSYLEKFEGWEARKLRSEERMSAGKKKGRQARKHQEFDRFLMRQNFYIQFSASQLPGFLASQPI